MKYDFPNYGKLDKEVEIQQRSTYVEVCIRRLKSKFEVSISKVVFYEPLQVQKYKYHIANLAKKLKLFILEKFFLAL